MNRISKQFKTIKKIIDRLILIYGLLKDDHADLMNHTQLVELAKANERSFQTFQALNKVNFAMIPLYKWIDYLIDTTVWPRPTGHCLAIAPP